MASRACKRVCGCGRVRKALDAVAEMCDNPAAWRGQLTKRKKFLRPVV